MRRWEHMGGRETVGGGFPSPLLLKECFMETVPVNLGLRSYPTCIGSNLLGDVGRLLQERQLAAGRVAVTTDEEWRSLCALLGRDEVAALDWLDAIGARATVVNSPESIRNCYRARMLPRQRAGDRKARPLVDVSARRIRHVVASSVETRRGRPTSEERRIDRARPHQFTTGRDSGRAARRHTCMQTGRARSAHGHVVPCHRKPSRSCWCGR